MVARSDIASFELAHPRGVTRHLVGSGALAAARDLLGAELAGRTVFAISARPILDLHGERLEALRGLAPAFQVLEVPDGEAAKTIAEAERLWRRLAVAGGKRDSLVVAFGGGSVGDLAGFVAGAFQRGLAWIQLPTTLLAQVDAAIGGKTAVDLPEAKNAVGLFHHPRAVIADAELLATLPPEQLRSGLVEVIKVAAVLDPDLLEQVEAGLDALLAGATEALAPVVAAAARAKVGLVAEDPEESGRRRLLNFGHTLGHALEAEVGYGRLLHGDAVAHGLRFALRLSVARGGDPVFARRLEVLLGRLRVPPLPRLDAGALLERAARDKKAREEGLAWVLADGPGRARVEERLPAAWVRGELTAWLGAAARESL